MSDFVLFFRILKDFEFNKATAWAKTGKPIGRSKYKFSKKAVTKQLEICRNFRVRVKVRYTKLITVPVRVYKVESCVLAIFLGGRSRLFGKTGNRRENKVGSSIGDTEIRRKVTKTIHRDRRNPPSR